MNADIHLYTDTVLVLASLGASLYCMRLHAAIRRLNKLDGGVGKAIAALNEAIRSSQQASASVRDEIAEAVDGLDRRYADLKARRQEVDDLLDTMDGQMGLQMRRCHEARQLTEKALTPLVRKAEMEIQTLTRALELKAQMERLGDVASPDMRAGRFEQGRSPEERLDLLRNEDERPYNPFLRAVGD